jgi:hypothetical protein
MMSATTLWKCPNDGLEWAHAYRKCPTCGSVNMPKCVTLHSAKTGRGADVTATIRLGKEIFKQRFGDDEAEFASAEQYEIVCDSDAAAWLVRPVAGAKNRTFYNGAEVPPAGCELADGGVIAIGKGGKLKLTVKFK